MERYDEPLRVKLIDLVDRTRERSGWPVKRTLRVLGIAPSTYFAWTDRRTLAPMYRVPKGLFEPLPEGKAAAYSRYIVHWELLTSMLAQDVVAVTHAALLLVPGAKPRIVHDRGAQFIGKEFKVLIKHFALQDIKIRVNHPESNGIYERFT
mgnify:CR=1 FL=1